MKRARLAAAVLLLALLLCAAGRPARAGEPVPGTVTESIAPGVAYRTFPLATAHGSVRVHQLTADLSHPGVRAGLLYPGAVAERSPVSAMAARQGAVAAVNGDFFNITEEQHPGVQATGAASGASVLDGQALKGAVPVGQRYGWALPPGADGTEVLGVGVDGRARTGRLTLRGSLVTPHATLPLGGLNQYALPVGSVGLFTERWGSVSRARAACGTDSRRGAPCTTDVYEVTVRNGRVEHTANTPGSGPVPAGSLVLLGREAGARALRALTSRTAAEVSYALASDKGAAFAFALGAYPLLRSGLPVPGLDATAKEPRTGAGIAQDGRLLHLVATDGREGTSTGLTVTELAALLRSLGCEEAAYLDGGASTTLVTRDPTTGATTVRNTLDQGLERRVPNGIALYAN
ncbi:phosphodiester glycosidase family protein [Streptomyces sp. NPDC048111]|uniref:phosphodiester glycosidase family protein n=1 Tax=Streptomyces sp. NPDC048111 TaxID=3365500 RepID=UPI00371808C9